VINVTDTVTLFRPVGPKELQLIRASGNRAFPPRLPEQPIFYPVLNEIYAVQIARDWNVKDSGSREQHLGFDDPKAVMDAFATWLEQHTKGRPIFVSDNLAFDWQFINYYFHRFLGRNPFGFSGRRIGDLYAGLVKDASKATIRPKVLAACRRVQSKSLSVVVTAFLRWEIRRI